MSLPYAAGDHRAAFADMFDNEIRPHNERFRSAAAVARGDRVLDVGCGTGQSTREAARAAVDADVLGLDISPSALEVARRISEREGLRNIAFEQADAQVHPLRTQCYDVCISRFGTMFFADPLAAFRNIAQSLRPGGRLAIIVWQEREKNEWSTAVHSALAVSGAAPAPPEDGPHAFSLGDPAVTERILKTAGFTGIDFTEVDDPVYYGPDVDAALEFVLGFAEPKQILASLDSEQAAMARTRLRTGMDERRTDDGVFFGSRSWIISGHVPISKGG